jgi:tetratricopeptide (TPR) repeat protein
VIGRERELDALSAAATDAAAGRGCVVFLAGPTGSGKSELLKASAERIAESGTEVELVRASCLRSGADVPLGAALRLLAALGDESTRGDRARRIVELIGQVAPPLLGLVPGIGAIAGVAVKSASDIGASALGDHQEKQGDHVDDVVATVRRIAADRPLLLVIDEAHWIDEPSAEVVASLAEDLDRHAVAVVLSYDPEAVDDTHPLTLLRSEISGKTVARDLPLGELDAAAVDDLLAARYGALPAKRLGSWLHDKTRGNLRFLEQYLLTLEEQGLLREANGGWTLDGSIEGEPGSWRLRGRLETVQAPETLLETLKPRLGLLDPEEQELLKRGAFQGPRFLSLVLARMLGEEEREVSSRLEPIQERRLITFEDVDDWWGDRSDLVAFDPAVLQELVYSRAAISPRKRREGHRQVAEAYEALVSDVQPRPRQALLEIARHYVEAREPVRAATLFVEVAESTFAQGADRETALHARSALDLLGAEGVRDGSPEIERLFARAALLLLLGGEASWRAATVTSERLFALAHDAGKAAEACGDGRLRAGAVLAAAQLTLAYGGRLETAVEAYAEAVEVAREVGDAVTEFAALLKLGHHRGSLDLHDGAAALEEARELLASGRLEERLEPDALALERGHLDSALGIAKFDLGAYGEAGELLQSAVGLLSAARLDDDYGWALCFLAQLQTSLGLWDEAEASLRDAIAVFEEEHHSLGARGYFRALLGRVGVEREPQQLDVARRELEAGRKEAQEAGYGSLQPLLDAYWAELLIAEGDEAGRRAADELLAASESYGWKRGEVLRDSLRARLALEDGRRDDALAFSRAAYDLLREGRGAVTAVRNEEIVYVHASALAAAGDPEAAERFAEAASILRAKADSLTDEAQRESLLQRVRLSREILAAARTA